MAKSIEEIMLDVLELPGTERELLALRLVDLVEHSDVIAPDEWNSLWLTEARKRLGEIERGDVECVDGEEAIAMIRQEVLDEIQASPSSKTRT